jgi:hypothetical protein
VVQIYIGNAKITKVTSDRVMEHSQETSCRIVLVSQSVNTKYDDRKYVSNALVVRTALHAFSVSEYITNILFFNNQTCGRQEREALTTGKSKIEKIYVVLIKQMSR